MWCGACGVAWCGVVWCGVVWRGVVWCGVVWCGVVWCGVVRRGMVWRGASNVVVPVVRRVLNAVITSYAPQGVFDEMYY